MFRINEENAIVLASESTRRIDILRTLGVSFSIIPPAIDERRRPSESPKDYTLRMAYEKAQKVGNLFPDKWIIGADTVVVHKGKVLGKPKTEKDAFAMLRRLKAIAQGSHRSYILNMSRQIDVRTWRKRRCSSRT
jgi:septum formation protein